MYDRERLRLPRERKENKTYTIPRPNTADTPIRFRVDMRSLQMTRCGSSRMPTSTTKLTIAEAMSSGLVSTQRPGTVLSHYNNACQ